MTSTENLCPFSEDLPAIFKVQIHVRSGLAKNKRDKNKSFVSTPSVSERVALSGTVTIKLHFSSQNWVLMSPSGKVWGEKSSPFPTLGTSEETGLIGVAASALQTLARRCLEALESW